MLLKSRGPLKKKLKYKSLITVHHCIIVTSNICINPQASTPQWTQYTHMYNHHFRLLYYKFLCPFNSVHRRYFIKIAATQHLIVHFSVDNNTSEARVNK